MDYRCEHMNIEIGSINEILSDTCVHMNSYLRKKRELKNQNFKKEIFKRKYIQKLFSSSDTSDEFTEGEYSLDIKNQYKWNTSSKDLTHKSKKQDEIVFESKENEILEEDKADDVSLAILTMERVCEEDFNDFKNSFDILLKQHYFIKVPGLKDYFFYWPQSLTIANFEELFSETLEGNLV